MHLMNTPRNFDVVLTENLFGDILSDESGVITGSLGMLPSATVGGAINLYEPVHGSAPDIAGKGIANPLGAILTAAMLLRHSAHLETEAQAVESAVRTVLERGHRSADLLGNGNRGDARQTATSTQEMGKLVNGILNDTLVRQQSLHAV
jgi:3-isopropylmalate dehydrogenase